MSRRRKLARHPNPRENDRCFWWHDEEQFKGKKDREVFLKRSSKMSSCSKRGRTKRTESLYIKI
jgi:hypothetical protein